MNWLDRRAAGRLLVLDGGIGSELRRRGVTLSGDCWSAAANLAHRELLVDIHRDYIDAGADIVTANTFATSRFVLECAGLGAQFGEINDAAIAAATDAIAATGREISLAASLSCMPPAFDQSRYPLPDDEYRDYAELADRLAGSGAELLLLEMMQHAEHAVAACRAAQASGLPFWIGISCRFDANRRKLVSFDDFDSDFDALVEAVLPFEPAVIAVMHSPVAAVGTALARLRDRWSGQTAAYAEVPYREDPDWRGRAPVSPAEYAAAAAQWIDAGAVVVGGCCGTTPAHIAALRQLVDNREPLDDGR